MYSRSYASNGITEIADRYPESREECIAIISKQLENFEENDEELNAFLVTNLLLNFFKNMSTSSAKQNETSSTTPEESYLLPLPPARTPSHSSDKIIKFSGKRIIKKKGKKKR